MWRGRWDWKARRTSSKVLFVYLEISAGLLCRRPPPSYRFRGLMPELLLLFWAVIEVSFNVLLKTIAHSLLPRLQFKTPSSLSSGNNANSPPPLPFKSPHSLKSIITWKMCRAQFCLAFVLLLETSLVEVCIQHTGVFVHMLLSNLEICLLHWFDSLYEKFYEQLLNAFIVQIKRRRMTPKILTLTLVYLKFPNSSTRLSLFQETVLTNQTGLWKRLEEEEGGGVG